MAQLTIRDLEHSAELDAQARSEVRGGGSWLDGLGPVANVDIDIEQNIIQLQKINVNALNDVGVIGPSFGGLRLNLKPEQRASTSVLF